MTLTKKDLNDIRDVVTDIVEFAVEKSELSLTGELESKFEKAIEEAKDDILETLGREISDIAETNQVFLEKFGDHEDRITKLEVKTSLAK